MDSYSHRERIQMILAGEKPDRYAGSLWRHFFHMEHHAEGLVEAMLHFQKELDWDFMKINPRADYHIEGWGFEHEWSHDEFTKHRKIRFPISTPDDWASIKPLSYTSAALSEHLKAVSMIRKRSDRELPILMTVFTPLAIAGRMLADRGSLADHLREHPDKVMPALEAITVTFIDFVTELRNAGADGIFFATLDWASNKYITWEEYRKFSLPYDLRVIEAAGNDAMNILHICSSECFLAELPGFDFKSRIYNWDASDPTNPPVDRADEFLRGGIALGGVDENGWLLHSTPREIEYQMARLKDMAPPDRLMIGPGCAIPPEIPMENLKAVRDNL